MTRNDSNSCREMVVQVVQVVQEQGEKEPERALVEAALASTLAVLKGKRWALAGRENGFEANVIAQEALMAC